MNAHERKLNQAASRVIGSAYEVSIHLGAGFLEKVYENALVRELTWRGLDVKQQAPLEISYKGATVGRYIADLVVEGVLVVELKCADEFSNVHFAQVINYLRASGMKLGLLLNFKHPKVEWKRIVYKL